MQFQHARIKNAGLVSFEPYELFRHEVVKAIEPEATWQPTGVPLPQEPQWYQDEEVCGRIARRARDLALVRLFDRSETTAPLPDGLLPKTVESIYVTIYIEGRLRGCIGSVIRNLDEDLKKIVDSALRDDRFAEKTVSDAAEVAVTVSILFDPLELGEASAEEVVQYYRHGDQTLMVYQGERLGLLLPFVASFWDLDPVSFAKAVIEKSGLQGPPYYWCRFDCTTWLAEVEGTWRTMGGFPSRALDPVPSDEQIPRRSRLHVSYLLKHLKEDGTFYSRYQPLHNQLYEYADPARQAHGAWVLTRAHKVYGGTELGTAVNRVIDALLAKVIHGEDEIWLQREDESSSVAESSFLLLALSNLRENDPRRSLMRDLAVTLWKRIELPHGRIATHRDTDDPSPDPFQDYFPGQVLLALAVACQQKVSKVDEERLRRSFQYYRHRFRYKRHFGQVAWLMQAFSRWFVITGESYLAEMVVEIGDWILGYQQEKTGAFINDHQSDTPGYTTALYLEGIAAAVPVVALAGDDDRRRAYIFSLMRGFSFLDRLTIQERDRTILPNPDFAIGGLRQGLYYSEVRTDFVQHSLSAILEFDTNPLGTELRKSAAPI
jgi:AMMECR1 domain-containing protein